MQPGRIVDLFAGAGGWDEGLRELGYAAVGIDNDRWACATARAAGHERIEADIAALDPQDFAPVWGLIGSPPCQAYSNAGKGLGRFDKQQVIACAHELAAGHDTRAEHLAACRDPRSLLTVEPLRWAVALRPRWVALEQVPARPRALVPVRRPARLPRLRGDRRGAERRAVRRAADPQARLPGRLARRPGRAARPDPSLLQPAPPDEIREEERDLLPWVSMADALGWARDAVTHTNNQTASGSRPQRPRPPGQLPGADDRHRLGIVDGRARQPKDGEARWLIAGRTGRGGDRRRPWWPTRESPRPRRATGTPSWRPGDRWPPQFENAVRVSVEEAAVAAGLPRRLSLAGIAVPLLPADRQRRLPAGRAARGRGGRAPQPRSREGEAMTLGGVRAAVRTVVRAAVRTAARGPLRAEAACAASGLRSGTARFADIYIPSRGAQS